MAKQEFPQVAVGALIVNPEGRIFLAKSHKWNNKYVVPGGRIELGERMEDAVKREIKEETGLDVHSVKFVNAHEAVYDAAFWKRKHFIFLDFQCRTNATKAKLNDEFQEYVWENPKKALRMELGPYTRKLIEEFVKMGKRK